jgi:hypothetical protein
MSSTTSVNEQVSPSVTKGLEGGTSSVESLRLSEGEVFAGGGLASSYEPIEKYEGRHRYDPTAQWTEAEEKKLVRRVCRLSCPNLSAGVCLSRSLLTLV